MTIHVRKKDPKIVILYNCISREWMPNGWIKKQ